MGSFTIPFEYGEGSNQLRDNFSSSIEMWVNFDVLNIDFNNAFDKATHGRLIRKITGIQKKVTTWLPFPCIFYQYLISVPLILEQLIK